MSRRKESYDCGACEKQLKKNDGRLASEQKLIKTVSGHELRKS